MMSDGSEKSNETIRVDLHIHSALSPCAEAEMTPGNIVGISKLIGLDVIALTDHQSCGNCQAAMHLSDEIGGPLVLPGIEATSAEEIHLLCLFDDLQAARFFEEILRETQLERENRPEIFGHQYYFNRSDQIIGEETRLLLMPSRLRCDELATEAYRLGGACLPAHVDREANSIMATLGAIPAECSFAWIEISRQADPDRLLRQYPELKAYNRMRNSDAHRLADVADPGWPLPVPGFRPGPAGRKQVVQRLRNNSSIYCPR